MHWVGFPQETFHSLRMSESMIQESIEHSPPTHSASIAFCRGYLWQSQLCGTQIAYRSWRDLKRPKSEIFQVEQLWAAHRCNMYANWTTRKIACLKMRLRKHKTAMIQKRRRVRLAVSQNHSNAISSISLPPSSKGSFPPNKQHTITSITIFLSNITKRSYMKWHEVVNEFLTAIL